MCDQCDATYPVRKSLSSHKRLKHGDLKQFNCKHCVYATTKKENLEQHVKSVHEKVKEICETCGDKSNLNKHIKNSILNKLKEKVVEVWKPKQKN